MPFLSGFILAVAIAVPVFVLLYRRRSARHRSIQQTHQKNIQQLSQLTGGLAHEIKNPLSTIKINLKLITEEARSANNVPDSMLKRIAVVQKETERLHHTLDDFLRFVGKPELNTKTTDLNLLISDMADFYTPQASAANVTVRLDLAKQPLTCKIDPDMVKQVILNMLINAVQAMPKGGDIIINTKMCSKNAKIQITDTGTGIQPEKIEKIFQAYYTSKPAGSGLGLAIAKKIIDAHEGQISVNSEPGKGTSFSITLPAV